MSRKANK